MNTIINKGIIKNSVLLDNNFNSFLRSDSSKEGTHSVQLRVREADHFVTNSLINLQPLPITHPTHLTQILPAPALQPGHIVSIHSIGVDDSARFFVMALPGAPLLFDAEVFKAPAGYVPLVALFGLLEAPLEFFGRNEVFEFVFEGIYGSYLQILGIFARN